MMGSHRVLFIQFPLQFPMHPAPKCPDGHSTKESVSNGNQNIDLTDNTYVEFIIYITFMHLFHVKDHL